MKLRLVFPWLKRTLASCALSCARDIWRIRIGWYLLLHGGIFSRPFACWPSITHDLVCQIQAAWESDTFSWCSGSQGSVLLSVPDVALVVLSVGCLCVDVYLLLLVSCTCLFYDLIFLYFFFISFVCRSSSSSSSSCCCCCCWCSGG